MEIQVEVSEEGENRREYVGIEVCRGPGVMRVLLTRPYGMAGQTVSVPLEQIDSVVEVESATLGEPVRAVDEHLDEHLPDTRPMESDDDHERETTTG